MSTKERYASDMKFKEQNDGFAADGLTPQELAFLAGTTPEIIGQLADLDLIIPSGHSANPLFSVETVQTVRKILRMRRHLQINLDAMNLIFDLLDRIDALEERISELEK